MIHKVKTVAVLFLLFAISSCNAQIEKGSDLFATLKAKDSLLFEVGFNQCNLKQMEKLVVDGIEFYHDRDGITKSKKHFIKSVKENLCFSGKNVIERVLDKASLEVFPLYKGDNLYGALQTGIHSFGDTKANFSHIWLLENNEWKISRVINYNHHKEKIPSKGKFITLSNKDLKQYVGVYEFSPEFVLTVRIKGNQLYGGSQGDEVAINCYATHKFIDGEQTHDLEFILDKKGNVTNLLMKGDGMEMTATKK
ncbi:MAG: DUF3471 domain-containing protein [Cellulophaga sp.]